MGVPTGPKSPSTKELYGGKSAQVSGVWGINSLKPPLHLLFRSSRHSSMNDARKRITDVSTLDIRHLQKLSALVKPDKKGKVSAETARVTKNHHTFNLFFRDTPSARRRSSTPSPSTSLVKNELPSRQRQRRQGVLITDAVALLSNQDTLA